VGWNRYFNHVDTLIHVADYDEAGMDAAKDRKAQMKRGRVALPPGAEKLGISDINEAYVELGGNVIRQWVIEQREIADEQDDSS